MLIFHGPRLVVFSVPRTGSTSLHKALRPFADIEFSNPPGKKHMTVRRFENWSKDQGQIASYSRAAVIREPLARISSWYRYRRRPELKGKENSAEHLTFDAFVEASLGQDVPAVANIGNQHRFLTGEDGKLGVQELFCIEKREVMIAYFESLFGPLTLPHRNAAPEEELSLDPALERRLREARAEEFTLFSRVQPTGRLTLPAA
ncbi:MAG: sulfotransferase family 2 domain-containing protein [Pseudomonadota bacterium]